jgi:hypothetical protein
MRNGLARRFGSAPKSRAKKENVGQQGEELDENKPETSDAVEGPENGAAPESAGKQGSD